MLRGDGGRMRTLKDQASRCLLRLGECDVQQDRKLRKVWCVRCEVWCVVCEVWCVRCGGV